MHKEAIAHFSTLFKKEAIVSDAQTLEAIPQVISAEDNASLLTPILESEAFEAVHSLNKDSAPGTDEFSGTFFRCSWDIIETDLLLAAQAFLKGARYPRALADTLLILIPKTPNPSSYNNFCPIILCNFANKVISRIIANRMSGLLTKIVSLEQSGFVRGRDITNNVLLAQNLVSGMGFNTHGGNVAIKVDMEKAYDRLDWQFLIWVLRRFSFSEGWTDILLRSNADSWLSPVINGIPSDFIKSF